MPNFFTCARHKVSSSPHNIRAIKCRGARADHVVAGGYERATKFSSEKHLRDLDLDGSQYQNKFGVKRDEMWTGFIYPSIASLWTR